MKQGWEIKKLGEVCAFCSGYTPKESELLECGAVPYFKVSDMNHCDNLKYLTHTSLFLEDGCKVYPKHTIVFPKNGAAIATNKKRILAQDSVVDLNTGGVVANDALVYFEYLYLYFLNLDFRLHTRRGAVPTLDIAELKNKSIPVPPMEEQERIVEELDCLSGVIEKKREQLRELDALAQSIFYQMFGSVDGNHNNFEVKSLSEVFSIIKDGTHQTPQYTDDKENGIKFLSAKDVVSGTINWDNIKYIPKGLHLELHKRVAPQRNDILLCKNGTYGICALNETDEVFDIYVSLALLRPNNICIPKYLVSAINNKCTKLQFDKSIKGIGVPNLHLSEIKRTNIIVPPLTFQQEFADKIETIEKQKALIKQSITQTEELFNSRMAYYFN